MKKLLSIALLGACFLGGDALAAPRRDCSYSPLQDVVRLARNTQDIEKLIERKVNFNVPVRCGGDMLQLAVLRGNLDVLKLLLEKGGLSVDKTVSLADFPIDGAPREVPFLAFAAYYVPRADMMDLILQVSNNIFVEDSRKETILWYLNRNPILMNTDLYDNVRMKFLLTQVKKEEKKEEQTTEKRESFNKPVESNRELVEPDRKFNPDK